MTTNWFDFGKNRARTFSRKNFGKLENLYLLTWDQFQKFITSAYQEVMIWNFMCIYLGPLSTVLTIFVLIGSGFRKLWRHTFNMGKPIYGFSRLIARWILRIFSWISVHVCRMSLWIDLQNVIEIGSGSRISWRIENPSAQHGKSHLSISTCYISTLGKVIRLEMNRLIHINIVCRPVNCHPDLIRIVVLRIGQTLKWENPIVKWRAL